MFLTYDFDLGKERLEYVLGAVNMLDRKDEKIGSFSGGMKQRIGIAQALLNNPKIILFDEPTVGLDPEERVRFRNLIYDLATDCIVILSSHIVSDIDTIADKVAIMKNGGLIEYGSQNEIINKVKNNVFEATINPNSLSKFKENYTLVNTTRRNGDLIVRYISNSPIENSKKQKATLEDAYLFLNKLK